MTVFAPSQKELQDQSIVTCISEVAAAGYPESDYEYRGVIRSFDERGTVLVEQPLQSRRKPEWFINVRHRGAGEVEFVLQVRHYDTTSWQDADRAVLHPQARLDGASSELVELALPGWSEAPALQLKVLLSQSRFEASSARTVSIVRTSERAEVAGARRSTPETVPLAELDAMPVLTAQEVVIAKDVWNKFLAFQDLLVEMFFERLLHEEPELLHTFGDAVDVVPSYFIEMFDVAVRGLDRRTERLLRETYRGAYPAPVEGYKTVEEYAVLLADLGMRPHHWMVARRVWSWVLPHIPYLEEYDRENLAKGVRSAPERFFSKHVLPPALRAIEDYDNALSSDIMHTMQRGGDLLLENAFAAGMEFYRILFETHPDLLPYFGRSDVDSLAGHLMQSVAFLTNALTAGRDVLLELRDLSIVHTGFGIPPEAYSKILGPMLAVLKKYSPEYSPELERGWTVFLTRAVNVLRQPMVNRNRLLARAKEFLDQVADEQEWQPDDRERRWAEVEQEVQATGTYTHTYEELAYGAQLAWRNSAKCVGRISWRNMIVRDLRHVTDPDAMFRECVEHLHMGTNGGKVQIVMNVFRPKRPRERWGPRIWNSQYIRFAAYEQHDGSILGDPANLGLTRALIRLGWTPPETRTAFDVLPLVIEVPGQAPKMYEFPREDIMMVPLEHPTVPEFASLGLQWCAIPAIANFRMEIGGVDYGCLPFNGWFMETEITRNLWERYDKAEQIAGVLGLDTSGEQTLWRDRGFLELNTAVLHSFSRSKVTLVDHQTASRQFLTHDLREKRAGRECPAQWSWVVPAAGGSSTPVWHHEMRDFYLSPHYHYAADKWAVIHQESIVPGEDAAAEQTGGDRIIILYGSETGTAEGYARQTARRLNRYRPQVLGLDDADPEKLRCAQLVLVVTSTFGDGEMPGNAKRFHAWIQDQPRRSFDGLNFSVMALGSTVYPNFCAAGVTVDREFARIGGNRVVALHLGDEIKGQAETVRQWIDLVARVLGEDPTSADAAAAAHEVRLGVSFRAAAPDDAGTGGVRRRRGGGTQVPLVANRELLNEVIPGSRSTRFLAFEISGTDLTYETGDHVAVHPHNPVASVERLCSVLGLDPHAWFTTSLVDRAGRPVEGDTAYPEPVQVRQVLTEDLDLSLREPFDELVTALCKAATDPAERDNLETWVSALKRGDEDERCRASKKHISDNFLTVADLLEAFPSASLGLEQILELLPRLKPRLYSITSCSLVHPRQIHITVGVVQVTTDAGLTRQGLCSNYLAQLDPERGATVRIAVRTSNFRPPQDLSAPILLVGPGTGLSPLIGFLQHRELRVRDAADGRAAGNGTQERPAVVVGESHLFFGCRNYGDYLYQRELETWRDAGVLTHLEVAFSRLTPEKVYVQHLIGQRSGQIWEVLSQPNCHYYVCGDAKMADDVFEVLLTIVKTEGGLSHVDAVAFFRRMQDENRFVTDVWGVLLNFRKALAEVQEAKYTQGQRWLERMTAVPATV